MYDKLKQHLGNNSTGMGTADFEARLQQLNQVQMRTIISLQLRPYKIRLKALNKTSRSRTPAFF
jgi:hypothetical protein